MGRGSPGGWDVLKTRTHTAEFTVWWEEGGKRQHTLVQIRGWGCSLVLKAPLWYQHWEGHQEPSSGFHLYPCPLRTRTQVRAASGV